MHSQVFVALALAALSGWASADVPRKSPLTKYQGLWSNSPFTTKPPVGPTGPPPENIFSDYALGGVSPVKGGYRVTIINKKKPDERKYVYSGQAEASGGFQILSVERDARNVRGTVVHMMSGSQKGTVTYDEKLLKISTPPPTPQTQGKVQGNPHQPGAHGAAQPGANPPGVPAANQPGQPNQPNQSGQPGGVRAPRPRVIGPPPVPQAPTTQANPTSTQERPSRR